MALTVMPKAPNSLASALVTLSVPKLMGPDIIECASGSRPRVPEMLMTRPWSDFFRCGNAARVMRMRPSGFTLK